MGPDRRAAAALVRPLKVSRLALTRNAGWLGTKICAEVATADERVAARRREPAFVVVLVRRSRGQTGRPWVFIAPRHASSSRIQLTLGIGEPSGGLDPPERNTVTGTFLVAGKLPRRDAAIDHRNYVFALGALSAGGPDQIATRRRRTRCQGEAGAFTAPTTEGTRNRALACRRARPCPICSPRTFPFCAPTNRGTWGKTTKASETGFAVRVCSQP